MSYSIRPYAIWSRVTVPTPSGNQPRSLENLEKQKKMEEKKRSKTPFLNVSEEKVFDFFSGKEHCLACGR